MLTLWKRLQSGAVPPAALYYDPTVRRRIGITALTGAIAAQQGNLTGLRPSVIARQETPVGTLVTVQAERADKSVIDFSYLLRRRGTAWRVTYDTLLAAALPDAVAHSFPQGDAASKGRALAAGQKAADRFRTALFDASGEPLPRQR